MIILYFTLVVHNLARVALAAVPEAKRISLGFNYGLLVLSDSSEGTPVLDGSGMDGHLKIGKCFFRDQWLCPGVEFGYFYESWIRSRDSNGNRSSASFVLDGPFIGLSLDVMPLSRFVSSMPISAQPILRMGSEGGFGRLLSSAASSTADGVEASQTFTHYSYEVSVGLQISFSNGLFFKGLSGISRRSRKLKSTSILSDRLHYGGVFGMSF